MNRNFIIIGDSITYGIGDYNELGWATMLKKYVVSKDSTLTCSSFVHVAGFPGATSSDILYKLESILNAFNDSSFDTTVIIAIGINDTQFLDLNESLNIENYKTNMNAIIDIINDRGYDLAIVGLTRIFANAGEVNDNKYYDSRNINDFYQDLKLIENYDVALEDVCNGRNVKYISLKDVLDGNDVTDCLHPTSLGHKKIFETIKENMNL